MPAGAVSHLAGPLSHTNHPTTTNHTRQQPAFEERELEEDEEEWDEEDFSDEEEDNELGACVPIDRVLGLLCCLLPAAST